MDKQTELEHIPYKELHELIDNTRSDTLLVISKEKTSVYELMHLGEYATNALAIGNTEYTIRNAKATPIQTAIYRTKIDAFQPKKHQNHWAGPHVEDEYAPEAIAMSAEGPTDINQRIECPPCRGHVGAQEVACSCTRGGVVFYDDESQEKTSLRKEGSADPQCETCHGAGTYEYTCISCNGTGLGYLYPLLVFENRDTGQVTTEILNVAELIATGRLPLLQSGNKGQTLIAKFSELHKSMAKRIGVDPKRMAAEGAYHVHELNDPRSEVYVCPSLERSAHKKPTSKQGNIIAGAIRDIQSEIARVYMHPMESIRDEEGVIRGRKLQVFERPDPKVLLKELVDIVEANGWKLGYRRGFVETGVDGPSFIVLDEMMGMVGELSAEDSLEAALLNAHKAASDSL